MVRVSVLSIYSSNRGLQWSSVKQTQWHMAKHKKRHFQVLEVQQVQRFSSSVSPWSRLKCTAKWFWRRKFDSRTKQTGGCWRRGTRLQVWDPLWIKMSLSRLLFGKLFFSPLNSFISNMTASGAGIVCSTSYHGDVPVKLRSTENPGLTMKVPW